MKNMEKLQMIKEAIVTDKWANGSLAQMRYNSTEIWHQAAGYHWEGDTLYHNHLDIVLDTVNFPIVTKGFTAFLLQLLGNSEQLIFDKYYEKCLTRYKQVESRKPGSSMRNLDTEFYPLHVSQEKEFVTFSEKIHPYLSKSDIELINQYTEAYFKYIEQKYNVAPSSSIKSKTDFLSENLSKYGFFELEKVKSLSTQGKESLLKNISTNGLPYAIAMFDFLQFIQFLEKQYFDTKHKLYIEVSKWFGSNKEGRAVKGNISSLLNYSTENKNRYTAYQHKENVKNDYEQLK